MGTLLHSCAEMRELIKLSLGVVSGVGFIILVLHGGPGAPRGKGGCGKFLPHWFKWSSPFLPRNVFDPCMKS